jgi:hypothetical protein
MDRVNRIGTSGYSFDSFERRPLRARPEVSNTRALVPVQPLLRNEEPSAPSRRTSAAFLAHLIATERGEPQTRDRRRAGPYEASEAYEMPDRAVAGRAFSRLS